MPQKTYESFLCPESNFLKLNCNDDEERRRSDLEQHRDWAIPAWHLDNNVTVMLQWCDGWWQPISLLWRGKETDCCNAALRHCSHLGAFTPRSIVSLNTLITSIAVEKSQLLLERSVNAVTVVKAAGQLRGRTRDWCPWWPGTWHPVSTLLSCWPHTSLILPDPPFHGDRGTILWQYVSCWAPPLTSRQP